MPRPKHPECDNCMHLEPLPDEYVQVRLYGHVVWDSRKASKDARVFSLQPGMEVVYVKVTETTTWKAQAEGETPDA